MLGLTEARRQHVASLRDASVPVLLAILSLLVFALIWETAATRVYGTHLLPSVTLTLDTLFQTVRTGALQDHLVATLLRVYSGFALGSAVGVALGLAAGGISMVRLALDPHINFLRFVPAVALLTPFVVWFGIGEGSRIYLIAFATLFIVFLNTLHGIDDVPVNRLRAARALGAGRRQSFLLVAVPSAVPYLLTGMRIAMGISFATIIVAEMVSAQHGLGFLVMYGRTIASPALSLVAIFGIGALGWISDKSFQAAVAMLFDRFRPQH